MGWGYRCLLDRPTPAMSILVYSMLFQAPQVDPESLTISLQAISNIVMLRCQKKLSWRGLLFRGPCASSPEVLTFNLPLNMVVTNPVPERGRANVPSALWFDAVLFKLTSVPRRILRHHPDSTDSSYPQLPSRRSRTGTLEGDDVVHGCLGQVSKLESFMRSGVHRPPLWLKPS